MSDNGMSGAIRVGDRVSIVDRFGAVKTGRAVMEGPAGWVLNMGGAHGTPAIATDENIVKVVPRPARSRERVRDEIRRSMGLTKVRGARGGVYWE